MPVITISSDIGNSDFLIGAIKGQILSAIPDCRIADISHEFSSANYQQAAYICKNAFKYYPNRTLHLILLDFFAYFPVRVLLAEYKKQFIICPDNGILTMITGEKPKTIFAIPLQPDSHSLMDYTSAIISCVQKLIQNDALDKKLKQVSKIVEKFPMRSSSGADWIDSQIIYIDNFENVVLNLSREEFEEVRKNRKFEIILMRRNESIKEISESYASVPPGENLAWFNSAGYLELAINKGNMAGLFGLRGFSEKSRGLQNKLLYEKIRIVFKD